MKIWIVQPDLGYEPEPIEVVAASRETAIEWLRTEYNPRVDDKWKHEVKWFFDSSESCSVEYWTKDGNVQRKLFYISEYEVLE